MHNAKGTMSTCECCVWPWRSKRPQCTQKANTAIAPEQEIAAPSIGDRRERDIRKGCLCLCAGRGRDSSSSSAMYTALRRRGNVSESVFDPQRTGYLLTTTMLAEKNTERSTHIPTAASMAQSYIPLAMATRTEKSMRKLTLNMRTEYCGGRTRATDSVRSDRKRSLTHIHLISDMTKHPT
jgi:hypothetical protein